MLRTKIDTLGHGKLIYLKAERSAAGPWQGPRGRAGRMIEGAASVSSEYHPSWTVVQCPTQRFYVRRIE
jgi:hypothetical protein